MKLPGDNPSIMPRTRRMNGCGQIGAAHCIVALKLNRVSALFSLAVDMALIYSKGLRGSRDRSIFMGLPYFCAVVLGRGVPPETAVSTGHALYSWLIQT